MRLPWQRRDEAAMEKLALAPGAGALAAYARMGLPGKDTPAADLRLLAVDVETTGLDPKKDHLLSVGFVPVDGYEIDLGGAGRLLVRQNRGTGVGASATVHGLTDDALAGGMSTQEALAAVLEALAGRVLLAHHAPIETGFLNALSRRLHQAEVPVRVVDTMELARRALPVGVQVPPGALRLWTLRAKAGLPVYAAHDALLDALACAELYLAQLAEIEEHASTVVALGRLLA